MFQRKASVRMAMMVAAWSCSAATSAQFVVEVREARTGSAIDAKVRAKSAAGDKYLGRTNGQPLPIPDKCAGLLVSATPIYSSIYEAQDEDEKWKPCADKVTINLKKVFIAKGDLLLPSAEQARLQFAAFPQVAYKFDQLEMTAETGELAQVSTSAKALAEELEAAGFKEDAESAWALSAQSALVLIAQIQKVTLKDDFLVAKGERVVFTAQATQLVRAYQVANNLPNVGVIGPRTFESLATISVERK